MSVELNGPRCGCGGTGHLEALASGVALARDARAALARGSLRTWPPGRALVAAAPATGTDGAAELEARATSPRARMPAILPAPR